MITKSNLKHCFYSLTEAEIDDVMTSKEDYVLFELHVFNVGGYASAMAMDYDQETAEEAEANGQIFCDKDDFFRLYEECEAENKFFEKYAY